MKIEDVLPRELVLLDAPCCDRETCLGKMVRRVGRMYTRLEELTVTRDLLERERAHSSALGGGIAVPHVSHGQFKQVVLAIARCVPGIPYEDAPDEEPVHAVFLLILPEGEPEVRLAFLARLGRLIERPDFMGRFMAATDREVLYDEILDMDEGSPAESRGDDHVEP